MAQFVEYYEIKEAGVYNYYFMPIDADAKNKENFDLHSRRIWKVNIKTNRVVELKNPQKLPALNKAELLKIQLMASPVPFNEYYLRLEEVKRYRESHQTEEPPSLD